jgi:hypothetical protein
MDSQHNDQRKKKRKKKKENDLQNITHTTNDLATQTPLKPGMNTGAPER